MLFRSRRFPILRMHSGDMTFRPRLALRLLGIGLPMGLQTAITAIGTVTMQTAINGLGTIAVAAMTAGSKLHGFFTCVLDALAITMATFAGQNIGARKLDRVKKGLKAANISGICYSILALLGMIFLGKYMLLLFVDSSESQVIHLAYTYMVITVSFYIPLLFVNNLRFTIQGLGFTRVAMFAGVMELIARVVVALLLVPRFGFHGACFGHALAWLFADAFLIPCYFRITKKLHYRMYPAGANE